MDVNQYGPALFPTVKQVRHRLFEREQVAHQTRGRGAPAGWAAEPGDERREAIDRSE